MNRWMYYKRKNAALGFICRIKIAKSRALALNPRPLK